MFADINNHGFPKTLYQTFMLSIDPEIWVLLINVPVYVYPDAAKVMFIPGDTARAIV